MNTPPPSLLRQGLEAAENGDFARADAIARALLTQNPNDAHGFQIAGFSAYRQGDRQKALESFWRANRAAPGQPALLYWLGVLFRERGDFVQAERAFREAVQNAPLYGDALCSLAETLFHLDRKDEAQSIIEKAIEAEPSSSAVLARAARFFDVIHDAEQSRALAERAVLLNPADEIARIALLEIHLRAGRFGKVLSGVAPLLKDGADCNQRSQARLHHLARRRRTVSATTPPHSNPIRRRTVFVPCRTGTLRPGRRPRYRPTTLSGLSAGRNQANRRPGNALPAYRGPRQYFFSVSFVPGRLGSIRFFHRTLWRP